jgi:hypothetical protein
LKKYSGQIDGLTHDPETAQFEGLHKILEVNHFDYEDGESAVRFAEREFQDMRNTRPREGTKRKGLGVLWYDGGKGGSKLWYDAVSAEPVIAKKLGVAIRDRKAEEEDKSAKQAEVLAAQLAAAEAKAQKEEEERRKRASYNIDESWKPHKICAQFEFMPELPDMPALANWIQENITLSWFDAELHPRDNDHAWTIAYTAINNDLIVSTNNGFAGPRTLET